MQFNTKDIIWPLFVCGDMSEETVLITGSLMFHRSYLHAFKCLEKYKEVLWWDRIILSKELKLLNYYNKEFFRSLCL